MVHAAAVRAIGRRRPFRGTVGAAQDQNRRTLLDRSGPDRSLGARYARAGDDQLIVGKEPEVLLADEHRRSDPDVDQGVRWLEIEVDADPAVGAWIACDGLDRAAERVLLRPVVARWCLGGEHRR